MEGLVARSEKIGPTKGVSAPISSYHPAGGSVASQLVGDHQLGFAYAVRGLERTPLPLGEPVPTVREVLRAFVRLVLDGEPPPATPEDGARAVLIAEACHRSAQSAGPVAVSGLDG